MWTTKMSADREDKRRREEIERKAAARRIENLYRPLLGLLNPRPPYDEFHIDREMQRIIIDKIHENEFYASPELLNIFWDLRRAYYGEGNFNHHKQVEMFRLVLSEYDELKKMLGYGKIRKERSIEGLLGKFKSKIKMLYANAKKKLC